MPKLAHGANSCIRVLNSNLLRIPRIAVCFLIAFSLHAQQPKNVRGQQSLNSGWLFKRQADPGAAVEAEFVGAEKPGYDAATWTKVVLPHTWDATPDHPFTVPRHFRGLGWYRRSFVVPESWEGRRVFVHFKGVCQIADVWINGQHAGTHTGGFTSFEFDEPAGRKMLVFEVRHWITNSEADILSIADKMSGPTAGTHATVGISYTDLRVT